MILRVLSAMLIQFFLEAGLLEIVLNTQSETVLLQTGNIIAYAGAGNTGCPIHWCSKLQTEITLRSTGAECIALLSAMREMQPF